MLLLLLKSFLLHWSIFWVHTSSFVLRHQYLFSLCSCLGDLMWCTCSIDSQKCSPPNYHHHTCTTNARPSLPIRPHPNSSPPITYMQLNYTTLLLLYNFCMAYEIEIALSIFNVCQTFGLKTKSCKNFGRKDERAKKSTLCE